MSRLAPFLTISLISVIGCESSGPRPFLAQEKRVLWQEYQYKQAAAKEEEGDLIGAVEILRRIQATEPDRPEPYLDIARLLMDLKWYPQVEDVLDLAADNGVADPHLPIYRAMLLVRLNRAQEALEILERAEEAEFLPARYLVAVSAAENLEDRALATHWAQRGVDVAPDVHLTQVLAGLEWLNGDLEASLGLYERALKLKPGDPTLLEAAALTAFELGDWFRSRQHFEALRATTELRPVLCMKLGQVFRRLEETERALEWLYRSEEGGVPEAWQIIGAIYLDRGEFERARLAWARYLQLAPTDVVARYGLARAALLMDRPEEALETLKAHVGLEDSYLLCCALGDAKIRIGDEEGAEDAYRRAADLNPEAEYPKMALESLKQR